MADQARDFRERQYEFCAHMRDPQHQPAPEGVEDRRLQIYRDLLFKNVASILAGSFPVLRGIISDDRWTAMMRDYFASHQAHTPYFPKLATEFLLYLANERDDDDDPPFINELAHYEWLEVEASLDTRELDDVVFDADGDLMAAVPVHNPIARPNIYAFPVHTISAENQPQEAPEQPTYLVVFRNFDDQVKFMELNAVSARLLELVINNSSSPGRELLAQIANELNHPDPEQVLIHGAGLLEEFRTRGVVLGTR